MPTTPSEHPPSVSDYGMMDGEPTSTKQEDHLRYLKQSKTKLQERESQFWAGLSPREARSGRRFRALNEPKDHINRNIIRTNQKLREGVRSGLSALNKTS